MSNSLLFRFDAVPPSLNRLYYTAQGRRHLSTEGKAFKNRFIAERGGTASGEFLNFQASAEIPYMLEIWILLPAEDLYNAGWGKSRATKYKYKNIDASNLIKLLEDSVAELVGLSDRQNWSVAVHKRASSTRQAVCRLTPLDLEADPYAPPC